MVQFVCYTFQIAAEIVGVNPLFFSPAVSVERQTVFVCTVNSIRESPVLFWSAFIEPVRENLIQHATFEFVGCGEILAVNSLHKPRSAVSHIAIAFTCIKQAQSAVIESEAVKVQTYIVKGVAGGELVNAVFIFYPIHVDTAFVAAVLSYAKKRSGGFGVAGNGKMYGFALFYRTERFFKKIISTVEMVHYYLTFCRFQIFVA